MRRRNKITVKKLMKTDIHAPSIGHARSSRVDDAHSDHAQRGHAGYEEIVAAAGLDELGNSLDDERRLAGLRIGWDHIFGLRAGHASTRRMVADDRAGVVARVGI